METYNLYYPIIDNVLNGLIVFAAFWTLKQAHDFLKKDESSKLAIKYFIRPIKNDKSNGMYALSNKLEVVVWTINTGRSGTSFKFEGVSQHTSKGEFKKNKFDIYSPDIINLIEDHSYQFLESKHASKPMSIPLEMIVNQVDDKNKGIDLIFSDYEYNFYRTTIFFEQ